ncbi:MAG: hypothetical protein ACI39H_09025 [Lachnospiraceae bacterium]
MQEREISLELLFWKIVGAWKVWILAALICAVLLPTLQYVRATGSYRESRKAYEEAMKQDQKEDNEKDSLFDTFSIEEQQQLEDAIRVQTLLNKNRQYVKNAALMNVDPWHEQVLTLTYSVDTHYTANYTKEVKQNYTNTILSALSIYAATGLDQTKVWQEKEETVSQQHLSELISSDVAEIGNNFIITVIGTDKETLVKASANIQKLMKAKAKKLSESITEFDLILVSEDFGVREDEDLSEKQQNVQNAITNYNTTFTNLTSSMTEEQRSYLETQALQTEGEEGEAEAVLEEPVKPSFSVKYMVLGAMVGIFLAAFVIALLYVFSGKLHSCEELGDGMKLRQFGVISLESRAKGMDGLIRKLSSHGRKQLSTEESLRLAASNVALYCKNAERNRLYLTGTEIEKLSAEWLKQITEILSKNGLEVTCGGNVNYDAVSLEKAVEHGAVVILEQTEVSLVPEIMKEIRTLQDQGVDIIGCIGVE